MLDVEPVCVSLGPDRREPKIKIRAYVNAIHCTMVLVDTLVSGVRDVPDGDHDLDSDSVAVRRVKRTRGRALERC